MKTIYNLSDMIKALEAYYSSRRFNASELVNKYLQVMDQEIKQGIMRSNIDQRKACVIPIEWERIKSKMGQDKNKRFWRDWFHENFPLVEILSLGSNQKGLTIVRVLDNDYRQDLENVLEPHELWDLYFGEDTIQEMFQDSNYFISEIDIASLQAYISKTQALPNRNETLDENLRKAKLILKLMIHLKNQYGEDIPALPQRIRESEFGRQYLIGLNLQNCHKELRKAALGDCHQYDLEASVYAWKLDTARSINPNLKFSYTLEYIDYKNKLRSQIAKEVFGTTQRINNKTNSGYTDPLKVVKEAITAIGFGARATNACWMIKSRVSLGEPQLEFRSTALREIIRDKEKLDLFLNNDFIKNFMIEQKIMTDLIYDHVKDMVSNIKILRTEKRQTPNKSKTIAYLYQHSERLMLDALVSEFEDCNVLLTCHDGFYTRNPISLSRAKEILREYNQYVRIDHTVINRYYDHLDMDDHKTIIMQQEMKANGGLVPLDIARNYDRIENKRFYAKKYDASDEFDNGFRNTTKYDLELDPFYEECNEKD